jgi:hypothetical protein
MSRALGGGGGEVAHHLVVELVERPREPSITHVLPPRMHSPSWSNIHDPLQLSDELSGQTPGGSETIWRLGERSRKSNEGAEQHAWTSSIEPRAPSELMHRVYVQYFPMIRLKLSNLRPDVDGIAIQDLLLRRSLSSSFRSIQLHYPRTGWLQSTAYTYVDFVHLEYAYDLMTTYGGNGGSGAHVTHCNSKASITISPCPRVLLGNIPHAIRQPKALRAALKRSESTLDVHTYSLPGGPSYAIVSIFPRSPLSANAAAEAFEDFLRQSPAPLGAATFERFESLEEHYHNGRTDEEPSLRSSTKRGRSSEEDGTRRIEARIETEAGRDSRVRYS